MSVIGEALNSAAGTLSRLTPPIISTLPVGRTDGAADGFTIILHVRTDRDVPTDEQSRLIAEARPIIEQALREQSYPDEAIPTGTFLVHYEDASRNMRTVGDCLGSAAAALRQLAPPVISTLHLGPFSGEPADFEVTLIVATAADVQTAEQCRLIEQARPIIEERLRDRGYPLDALATFTYVLASQEDIDKAGGWWKYLR